MNVGMLWFDNDPKRSFDEKVSRAVEHYRRKYGRAPDVCFVNPRSVASEAQEKTPSAAGLLLRTSKSVLPNHFWIGIRDQ
ncbi:MAG: hypothetical protein HY784_10955 [Chloroflexi bacterium]|nr:hypothetical protein [Chloroflexota bacterium]